MNINSIKSVRTHATYYLADAYFIPLWSVSSSMMRRAFMKVI